MKSPNVITDPTQNKQIFHSCFKYYYLVLLF